MAELRLWAAEHSVARCGSRREGRAALDAVAHMLRSSVEWGRGLADEEQHDMAFFEARCAVVRSEMERASRLAAERAAAARQLPPQIHESDFVLRNPALAPPAAAEAVSGGNGLEERLAREAVNIGWLPAPLPASASFAEAGAWLARAQLEDAVGTGDEAGVQLALVGVERLVYTRALSLAVIEESEVGALEKLVERYRLILHGFVDSEKGGARMQAELRSRETLVVWAAFCLVHKASARSFRTLEKFGAPKL